MEAHEPKTAEAQKAEAEVLKKNKSEPLFYNLRAHKCLIDHFLLSS